MGDSGSLEIIDFHCHHIPSRWTPTTARGAAPDQRQRWETINRLLADEVALVADIEAGDITARVVNTSTALVADADGNVPADIFEPVNDSLAELVARHRGRLYGLASVDAFAGDRAAREITRAVRDLGLRGVFLESAKGDLLLDALEARPALATAAELGVPVFVHPINPQPLTRQLARYGRLGTLFARGTVNAASLIALLEGGVFDEIPNLQVVVTTLAVGAVLLGGGLTGARLRADTPELLRRHVYIDTMGFDPALIRSTVEILGADHVLVGSDWPIVNDRPIRERVERALAASGLDAEEQRLVAAGNSRRLLAGTNER
jgi:aminocarboxymuconate-semialdehyde decarboxylase